MKMERWTNLIPELLDMVDEKKVSFNPAVELSYLSPEQQQEMIKAMMVSAGDPIKYADIHSSYWQQYLAGFGRLSK